MSKPSLNPILQVRHASLSDIDFLAGIVLRATTPPFEGSFWDQLTDGTKSTGSDFLVAALQHDAIAWCPIKSWLIAECDGAPVGACAVPIFDALSARTHPLELGRLGHVAAALGWTATEIETFRITYNEMWKGMDFEHPAHAIVEFLATSPGAEGKGVARRLIAAAAERARAGGHDALGITVILGNDRARALYAKLFEPHARYGPELFDEGFPGLEKFRMRLDSRD